MHKLKLIWGRIEPDGCFEIHTRLVNTNTSQHLRQLWPDFIVIVSLPIVTVEKKSHDEIQVVYQFKK